MSGSHRRLPAERHVDLDRPSLPRVYDYFLGGTASWAIDRYFVDEVLQQATLMSDVARVSQTFTKRVVDYLVAAGVRQFVDVGFGALTSDNTHQVADEFVANAGLDGQARVVYVTSDSITAALAEVQLCRSGDLRRHAAVQASLHDIDHLWQQVLETDVIDESQPVALLLIGSFDVHQAGVDSDDGAVASVAELRKRLPAGSYIALSHLTDDDATGDVRKRIAETDQLYTMWTRNSLTCRSRTEIAEMLTGLQLVGPGWTSPSHWGAVEREPLPQHETPSTSISARVLWAGVGHKP